MKHCNNCNAQLNDDEFFCPHCGNQLPLLNFQEKTINSLTNNETNNINHKNLQNSPKQSPLQKPKTNKLIDVFRFENIGEKFRKIAKTISTIYIFLFVFILVLAVFLLIMDIFVGSVIFESISLIVLITIPVLYLLLIIAHIPLWKLHAYGDIYDSLCNNKSRIEKDKSDN